MAGSQGRGALFDKVQRSIQPLNPPGRLDRAIPPRKLFELAHLRRSGSRSKSVARLQAGSTGIDGGFYSQAQPL
jgi:hypothetical protein